MQPKLIIISAPSGSGKSTLVNHLLSCGLNLAFSISATSRPKREYEQDGVDYFFLTKEAFEKKIENDEFVEYEEVYTGCFYGTLRSELDRLTSEGKVVIFDVDVVGAINLKRMFGENALSVFIAPPSIEVLRQRLIDRHTENSEMIEKRVGKARFEMTFAPKFDVIVVNDELESAKKKLEEVVRKFIGSND